MIIIHSEVLNILPIFAHLLIVYTLLLYPAHPCRSHILFVADSFPSHHRLSPTRTLCLLKRSNVHVLMDQFLEAIVLLPFLDELVFFTG